MSRLLLGQEWWQLRKGCVGAREEDVEFEEELYSAGTVVVWSHGSRGQASNVYKAFTVDSQVQQVGSKSFQEEILPPVEIATMSSCFSYLFAGLVVQLCCPSKHQIWYSFLLFEINI